MDTPCDQGSQHTKECYARAVTLFDNGLIIKGFVFACQKKPLSSCVAEIPVIRPDPALAQVAPQERFGSFQMVQKAMAQW